MFGSINAKSGRVPAAASFSNSANGTKCVASRSFSREKWMIPANDSGIDSHVDLPRLAVLLEPLEDRLRVVLREPLLRRAVHDQPDEVAAVQNERFMNVCDGTSQNQWSNTPKSRAIALKHRHLLRRVPGHDVRVLLVGRLTAHLAVKVLM